jgi:hypothetical protein
MREYGVRAAAEKLGHGNAKRRIQVSPLPARAFFRIKFYPSYLTLGGELQCANKWAEALRIRFGRGSASYHTS